MKNPELLAQQCQHIEEQATKLGLDKEVFSEFASLKNSLGTPRKNILSFSDVLISFLESDNATSIVEVRECLPDANPSIESGGGFEAAQEHSNHY